MQKLGLKLFIIGTLCAVFAIGLFIVQVLVSERQAYHNDVINDIKSSYVNDQLLVTPFLYSEHGTRRYYVFAKNSDISTSTKVHDDQYQRGIYEAISYQASVHVKQHFDPKDSTATHISASADKPADDTTERIPQGTPASTDQEAAASPSPIPPDTADDRHLDAPLKLIIATSDLRGVTPTSVTVNGVSYPARFSNEMGFSHLQVALPISARMYHAGAPLEVAFDMQMVGIGEFGVMPLGDDVSVTLASDWQHPKFYGQALPTQKSLTGSGFNATWQSHTLGQHNQQLLVEDIHRLLNQNYSGDHYGIMTAFVHDQDPYAKTDRSIKYALLLIMVSFGAFFLFEVIKGRAIHPMQYLFVASALLVFYLLLLSLAEQVAFGIAYLIASAACVGLIGWYACYVLGGVKHGISFGVLLSSLYGAFYVILSVSSLNLLIGSLFCFGCIAAAMYATRHIDWYALSDGKHDDKPTRKASPTKDPKRTTPPSTHHSQPSQSNGDGAGDDTPDTGGTP